MVVRGHAPGDAVELQANDLLEHLVGDGEVRHHLHAPEERRLETFVEHGPQHLAKLVGRRNLVGRLVQAGLHDLLRADVAGENDDGVTKVDFAALGIVEHAFVEHLEEELEHIGVGLLHFVEQHHAVGVAAHCLGEHAPLAVAHVAGRRALQATHAVRLLVLAHVDGDELSLAAVEHVGQGERGFGFAHAARPDEHEHTLGLVRVFEVGARGAHALCHGFERVRLAEHALGEQRLQVQHGLDFVFHHLAERNARPRGDDLGHHEAVDLHRDQRGFALQRGELVELGAQRRLRWAQLGQGRR